MSHTSQSGQFGPYLKQLRKQQGLTQIDLSAESQLSKSYISFLESGVRHPSREVVIRLSRILAAQQPELQDHMLIMAGFAPENTPPVNFSLSSLAKEPPDFSDYLQHTLQQIRQGQLEQAQTLLEKGFQRFSKPAQMQTLLAHLELARGNFEHAILSQQTALRQYDLSPEEQLKGLSQLDFMLNLGVMYFLWGDYFLFAQPPQQAVAVEKYQLALQTFQQGLAVEPDHLYLLDETARVHYNLADLLPQDQAESHWQAAVGTYQQVIQHPDKHKLSQQQRLDAGVFLALACSKLQRFEQAQLALALLSLYPVNYWLVPYAQACCFAHQYAAEGQAAYAQQALDALQAALALDPDAVRDQARHDRLHDLKAVASQPRFQEVIA